MSVSTCWGCLSGPFRKFQTLKRRYYEYGTYKRAPCKGLRDERVDGVEVVGFDNRRGNDGKNGQESSTSHCCERIRVEILKDSGCSRAIKRAQFVEVVTRTRDEAKGKS